MRENPKIVVAGAGSVGCFVGGLLAEGGRNVTLLARERIAAQIRSHGLHLSSLEGWTADPVGHVTTDASALSEADLVLVTVKSGATEEMAALIARHTPAGATVVSLQNGVSNVERLRAALSVQQVFAGMVSFNVLQLGEGRFHRGTSGPLIVEAGLDDTAELFRVPHLDVQTAADMRGVQWGKLLLNLNNALNALSGLPLQEQLLDRGWRRVLAAQQQEALDCLQRAGIQPWNMGPIPARLFPAMLRLPTPIFRLLVRSAVRFDPLARSSMWEDLELGRVTEVDELQGSVVRLAKRFGGDAPVNRRVLQQVQRAERTGAGSPRLSPETLLRP